MSEADDTILEQARKRFKRCVEWESPARALYRADVKFANADSDNNWQWPETLYGTRDLDDRPCLTINKTRQHNKIIKNDALQNKPSIKIRPTGGGATFEAATAYAALIKRIEYDSNATSAYDRAFTTAVEGGIGYVRVTSEYADTESFDQEARIRPVNDPLTVYLEPKTKENDGSDANYAFVFEDMDRDEFEEKNPSLKERIGAHPAVGSSGADADWLSRDSIRVAEYFRRRPVKDRLYAYTMPETQQVTLKRESEIEPELRTEFLAWFKSIKDTDPNCNVRDLVDYHVEWFKIAGDVIYERGEWHGCTIPIRRMVGEETIIEGQLDRKGHTRNLKDAQRMLNYNASGSVEYGALQTKTPYVAPAAATEGHEGWKDANVKNYSVILYNHIDDEGQPIPPPIRQEPPRSSELYVQGMDVAERQMMMASGQYQSKIGERNDAISGVAIGKWQRQGDNATYHFVDNQSAMIRGVGAILLEIIPKLYDTQRVVKIMAENGDESELLIHPECEQAYQEAAQKQNQVAQAIFNPSIGKYAVISDVGPDFATQRQEAWNALVEIIKGAPEWRSVIGDILLRAADFPMADEAATRIKRTIPAHVLGEGPTPEVSGLQEQLKNLQGLVVQLSEKLVEQKNKARAGEQKHDVDVYNAESQRLTAETNAIVDLKSINDVGDLEALIKQTISEMMGISLGGANGKGNGSDEAGESSAPMAGLRQAADGNHYMPDPARPGKYLMLRH